MDWITTSGRTLDEAKSHALDQLGIVADEAEFDIVSDVEKGLFGRVKSEAKIRARVRPKQTAVKEERGRRRGSSGGKGNRNQKGGGRGSNNKGKKSESKRNDGESSSGSKKQNARSGEPRGGNSQREKAGNGRTSDDDANGNGRRAKSDEGKGGDSPKREAAPKSEKQTKSNKAKRDTVDEHMSRQDQERAAQGFLEGVLDAFAMTGSVAVVEEAADDDAIEMTVSGDELGLLVGQKGVTLNSLQELTRTVVQREADGAKTDRLRVDVAGYRARRTVALRAFAAQIATDVIESGTEKLLEPMGPADRKVVHDAVNDIDGVETGSEGEEPRRRVVIRPV